MKRICNIFDAPLLIKMIYPSQKKDQTFTMVWKPAHTYMKGAESEYQFAEDVIWLGKVSLHPKLRSLLFSPPPTV